MDDGPSERDAMETAFRRLLTDGDIRQPDDIRPHEDGGIICFWHAEQLAVVIDPD
jgi:hypothetical protein